MRWRAGKAERRECFLFERRPAEFKLAKAKTCPAYLSANDSATGGYLAPVIEGDLSQAVVRRRRVPQQRRAHHAAARHWRSGWMPAMPGRARPWPPRRAPGERGSSERRLNGEARDIVGRHAPLSERRSAAQLSRFVQQALRGARAAELGWTAKPGDDPDTRLLRAALVPFVGPRARTPPSRRGRAPSGRWLAERPAGASIPICSVPGAHHRGLRPAGPGPLRHASPGN